MVGLIEHQQGIQNSQVVEKVQQAKQENLAVYQEYSADDLKEKQRLKRRQVYEAQKADDVVINEKQREKKEKRERRRRKKQEGGTLDLQKKPEHHE